MKFTITILATLIAVAVAIPSHKFKYMNSKLRPQEWFSTNDLEGMPSLDDVTLQTLEKMPAERGSYLIRKFYHLAQMKYDLQPSYVPSPSNIPVILYKEDGSKMETNLNQMLETVQQIQNFGQEEVTVFITGLPGVTDSILKANNALIQAYKWRYNRNKSPNSQTLKNQQNGVRTSSEEEYQETFNNEQTTRGNLIVIDLGSTINNMKRFALLDVEQTGNMIAKVLVQLTSETNVPHEIIHIVAQGIGAHVAGAAGRQYTRLTGQKLRRITALDPSKVMAVYPERLTGLARGDAEFVDAIHTNTEGMGTRQRVGNADFYPNGPSAAMPGTSNVVEASMRATRFYAESVRPGNERNFPAVPANSLYEYNQKNGYGKRAYMGIDSDFDLEGDYILEVNAAVPFGRKTMAEKQSTYHGVHNKNN